MKYYQGIFGHRSKIFWLSVSDLSVFLSLYTCLCVLIITRFQYKGNNKRWVTFTASYKPCQTENSLLNDQRWHTWGEGLGWNHWWELHVGKISSSSCHVLEKLDGRSTGEQVMVERRR